MGTIKAYTHFRGTSLKIHAQNAGKSENGVSVKANGDSLLMRERRNGLQSRMLISASKMNEKSHFNQQSRARQFGGSILICLLIVGNHHRGWINSRNKGASTLPSLMLAYLANKTLEMYT